MQNLLSRLATEVGARESQITAAVALLDGGATVPFIARYRKEATGGLDDAQLRLLEERLGYLRELESRRETVLAAIAEQGQLTPALEQAIRAAETRTRLEDLYRPYMKKRRTKAQIAREAGLEPLADALLADPTLDPEVSAAAYVDADQGVADTDAALDGARQILMERFAEEAELVGGLRDWLWSHALLTSRVVDGQQQAGAKFADYFDAAEPIAKIPSHRALALLRGRREGVLDLKLTLPEAQAEHGEGAVRAHFGIADRGRPADRWLCDTARRAWRIKIFTHLESELTNRLRETAEEEAIAVFGRNLRDLLLAAPAGLRPTMGLDPGLRTGVKVAVVDATGQLVATTTVYPFPPKNQIEASLAELERLARAHGVELVAIGNGTASRETDRLAAELAKRVPGLTKLVVSEAGASVYSASELASHELPGIDVSLRGAVSIARRLQDPLAELVKIEPKAIGVGQYQHDVNQPRLARTLDAVVEDCVNAVGVDVNSASPALLGRVAGLGPTLAERIVEQRNQHGPFRDRQALLAVPRLGAKAFEQAAGFLRISGGANPLDASAVHPEAYPVVERLLTRSGKTIREIIGNRDFLQSVRVAELTDERFGEPTVRDILAELEKPGRDPRPEFRTATFREGVEKIGDLKPEMVLEGVVTNVTNFGAFVDIGVHQDGLVHISQLADRFVKDPHSVVKAGDVVKVQVVEVDLPRQRIALTMRLGSADAREPRERSQKRSSPPSTRTPPPTASRPAATGLLGEALANALKKR